MPTLPEDLVGADSACQMSHPAFLEWSQLRRGVSQRLFLQPDQEVIMWQARSHCCSLPTSSFPCQHTHGRVRLGEWLLPCLPRGVEFVATCFEEQRSEKGLWVTAAQSGPQKT